MNTVQLQNNERRDYFHVTKQDAYYLRVPDVSEVGARSLEELGPVPDYHVVLLRTTFTYQAQPPGNLGRQEIFWELVQ